MIPQEAMIARVRELCVADPRVNAAMMYGSFTYGEADRYSDIEFLLVFEDDVFETVEPRAWLEQIAPVELMYRNQWGIQAVIFDNLVRGEFHFHRAAEMTVADAWPGVIAFPTLAGTLIVDKRGLLAPRLAPIIGPEPPRLTPAEIGRTATDFVNLALFGLNVAQRGEHARALEMLGVMHRPLLALARAQEHAAQHWLTPSRRLEQDLSPAAYARFVDCTAALDPAALRRAYTHAWTWGRALIEALRGPYGLEISDALLERISQRVAEWPPA